jgi:hypothetical protein
MIVLSLDAKNPSPVKIHSESQQDSGRLGRKCRGTREERQGRLDQKIDCRGQEQVLAVEHIATPCH